MISQEHLGAPIYWSQAPIYWSPKILFLIFWKGMKRKSYDKTRFCVSREGLPNGLGTFILEPGPHYIGAPSRQKHVFCFIFEHESNMNRGELKVLSPFGRTSRDTQNLVLS